MNPAPPCNGAWQDIESRVWDEMTPIERERTYERDAQSPSIVPAKDILEVIELAKDAAQEERTQPWFMNAVDHIKRKCIV